MPFLPGGAGGRRDRPSLAQHFVESSALWAVFHPDVLDPSQVLLRLGNPLGVRPLATDEVLPEEALLDSDDMALGHPLSRRLREVAVQREHCWCSYGWRHGVSNLVNLGDASAKFVPAPEGEAGLDAGGLGPTVFLSFRLAVGPEGSSSDVALHLSGMFQRLGWNHEGVVEKHSLYEAGPTVAEHFAVAVMCFLPVPPCEAIPALRDAVGAGSESWEEVRLETYLRWPDDWVKHKLCFLGNANAAGRFSWRSPDEPLPERAKAR